MKILTSRKVITDILLEKPIEYWHSSPKYGQEKLAHQYLADEIENWELYTFIGSMVPLDDSLYENKNKKVCVDAFVTVPLIRQLARKEVQYTSLDTIRQSFDKLNIPKHVKDQKDLFTKYIDMWFAADEEKLFPEIMANYLELASYNDNDIKLKGKALKNAITKATDELFKPDIYARYERNTKHLPKLLRHWAGIWNQWYVAVTPEKTLVAMGSYKGSGTRETHGYFAHAFATLSRQGKKIPTFYVGLDKNSALILHQKLDNLKIVGQDLDGNYRDGLEREKRNILFKDMLVYVSEGKIGNIDNE